MADATDTESVPARIGRYQLIQNPRFEGEPAIKPLGRGGTSAVFLVQQDLVGDKSIKRALKLFDPTEEVKGKRAAAGETYGRRHFLDEIAVVSGITHQNIVGIIDAGTVDDKPFFVMDYVDGPTLETMLDDEEVARVWTERASADPHLITRLAQQICWPLAYLHANRRFHFDIAPKNIFMRLSDDKPHLLLGDLGVSRHVPPIEEITDPDKLIFVAGTKAYTPAPLEQYRKANSAPLGELARLAAYWDIYALGTVILQLIEKWAPEEPRKLEALKLLCGRMQSDTTLTAAQVSSALDRLLPAHVLTVGIEELSTDATDGRRYISIPLAPVPTSSRVRAVLDHPVLNRLQLVPQLLLYRSVTPGGVHTAFESLLGSYGMALRCVTKLLSEPRFRESFSPKEHEEALLATLLSRVDKLPLDRILRLVKPDGPGGRRDRLNEMLAERRDGSSDLRTLLSSRFKAADLDAVVETLAGDASGLKPYQVLTRSLLESSLSARVMDYLQRDALHTGISAGSGIDAGNLIESLRWSRTDDTLGISRAGVFSAEHILCARYWMFARLYWNTSNRAITSMLRHVVSEILGSDRIKADYLASEFSVLDEAGALKALEQHWGKTAGSRGSTSTIMDLLRRPRPKPYQQLLERFSRNWGSDTNVGRTRMRCFERYGALELEGMRKDFLKNSSFRNDDPSIVLFDYPSEGALKLGEDVLVEVGQGDEKPLREVSDIVSLLPTTFNDTCVRLRVFHDPDLSKERRNLLREEVGAYLEAKVADATAD